MTAISQQQAWCKLAIAIAESQHAPREICFYAADEEKYPVLPPAVEVHVDGAVALWWWADRLGAALENPHTVHQGHWHQQARNAYSGPLWHGYQVTVKTYDASTLGAPADAMAAVRAIAAEADHCVCCTFDCGDRRGHVLDELQFVTPQVCVCGDVWPCTEESR